MRHLLTAICLWLALPVLGVLGAWLALDAAALAVLRHQLGTVLPDYALQSALLAAGVGIGVVVLGSATAAAVTLSPVAAYGLLPVGLAVRSVYWMS